MQKTAANDKKDSRDPQILCHFLTRRVEANVPPLKLVVALITHLLNQQQTVRVTS